MAWRSTVKKQASCGSPARLSDPACPAVRRFPDRRPGVRRVAPDSVAVQRNGPDRIGIARMHADRKAEGGGQPFGNIIPGSPAVGGTPDAVVVLLVQDVTVTGGPHHVVHTMPGLPVARRGGVVVMPAILGVRQPVAPLPGCATVLGCERPPAAETPAQSFLGRFSGPAPAYAAPIPPRPLAIPLSWDALTGPRPSPRFRPCPCF